MTWKQRVMRVVTTATVRYPRLWPLLRGHVQRDFDALAPTWETRISDEGMRPMNAALDALPSVPETVLDVGTGTGRVAREASARWPHAHVVGVDVSPGMVEQARKLGGGARYDVADSEHLPYEDGSFELLTLSNMIPFFGELARVTAPGGHVAIAFSMGPSTPIYVPLDRVRSELERRGFTHVATISEPPGEALLARRDDRS